MNLISVHRLKSALLISGTAVLLTGCYTIVSHPETSPAQHVTDDGHVVVPEDCGGCHSTNDLWSYHHNAQWMAPGHRSSLAGYYTYRYDHLFLGSGYYDARYYHRWASYYNTPWWWWGDGNRYRSQPRRYTGTPEVYVGRGHSPDEYDRLDRRNEFIPMIGPSTRTPRFTPVGQPVHRAEAASRARAASGNDGADNSAGRGASPGNSTRVERQPDPPPTTSAGQPTTSSSRRSSKDDDNSDDDDDNSDSGRGSAPSSGERRRR